MNDLSMISPIGQEAVPVRLFNHLLELGRFQYVVKAPFELSVEERIAALMQFFSRLYKPNVLRGEPQVIYVLTRPEMSYRRQVRS